MPSGPRLAGSSSRADFEPLALPACPQRRLVARAGRGRQVLEAPRAAELRGDCRVLPAERRARGCAAVGAAGLLRELAERIGIELRALDCDDVDGRPGCTGGLDRVSERRLTARLVPVGHDDDHPSFERLGGERARRMDERVVERGPLDRIDLDRPERAVGVAWLVREAGQHERSGCEGGDGKPVGCAAFH